MSKASPPLPGALRRDAPSVPLLRRLEARVLENPAYLSIVVRWITWMVAAAVVTLRAAPAANLVHAGLALALTGAWCVAITLFGPILKPRATWLPRPSVGESDRHPDLLPGGRIPTHFSVYTSVFDVSFSAAVIYATGGFRSPFYEFALTSVIAPSLLFRMRGALLAGAAFCGLFVVAVELSGPGPGAVIREGKLDGTLVSSLLNPFTVAIFCALLGHVMRALEEARRQTRALAAQEERSRVAREIHDGISQRIFAITVGLETLAEVSDRGGGAASLKPRLEDLVRVSKQALWEVRHYIHDLTPLLAGEAGLGRSVQNLVREFEAIARQPVALSIVGEERPLDLAVSSAAFRIVQEALANVYKHARAQRVAVTLRFGDRGIALDVHDDGAGFDPAVVARGEGLAGMRARAEEAGGTLRVESAPGSGTRVVADLPGAGKSADTSDRH